MSEPTSPCPNCGKPAFGQFCSWCGSPLKGAVCSVCNAQLVPGAKFCHRCGTSMLAAAPPAARTVPAPAAAAPAEEPAGTPGTPAPLGSSNVIPWAVAGIALIALIAMVAGQSMTRASGGDEQPGQPLAGGPGVAGSAPDISQMTPQQRAERLYDRMMGAFEAGHLDTVRMFAPMATQAYQMLDSLDLDQRYDLGRLGEISGDAVLARAEADTILKKQPTHLLGLFLAARAAKMRKDAAAARDYFDRLVKAEPAERAKQRPEYLLHANDITMALAEAKQR